MFLLMAVKCFLESWCLIKLKLGNWRTGWEMRWTGNMRLLYSDKLARAMYSVVPVLDPVCRTSHLLCDLVHTTWHTISKLLLLWPSAQCCVVARVVQLQFSHTVHTYLCLRVPVIYDVACLYYTIHYCGVQHCRLNFNISDRLLNKLQFLGNPFNHFNIYFLCV